MELETRDPVAQIDQARAGVAFDDALFPMEPWEMNRFGRLDMGHVLFFFRREIKELLPAFLVKRLLPGA